MVDPQEVQVLQLKNIMVLDGQLVGTFGSAGYAVRGMGTQTAALSAGLFPPGGFNASCYEYDGSSWTAGGSLPAVRGSMGTAGTQTAGLAFGGSTGPAFVNTGNSTYEYDGSSWTAGNNLNTARTYLAGFGIQTAAAGCGGYTGNPAATSNLQQQQKNTMEQIGQLVETCQVI